MAAGVSDLASDTNNAAAVREAPVAQRRLRKLRTVLSRIPGSHDGEIYCDLVFVRLHDRLHSTSNGR